MQCLKKIGQKMIKIESGNEFLTSIKGNNSGLKKKKFAHLQSQTTPFLYLLLYKV